MGLSSSLSLTQFLQDGLIRGQVDWMHGYCLVEDVDYILSDLARYIPDVFYDGVWHQWHCGTNNYRIRYCYQDQSSIYFAFNPASDKRKEELLFDDLRLRSHFEWGGKIYKDFPDLERAVVLSKVADCQSPYNKGVFFSFSGNGLRLLGDKNFKMLLNILYKHKFVCTRLDLALDFFDPANEIIPILKQCLYNAFEHRQPDDHVPNVSSRLSRGRDGRNKLRVDPFVDYMRFYDPKTKTCTNVIKDYNITWGDSSSPVAEIQIYDKYYQYLSSPKLQPIAKETLANIPNAEAKYWYRLEYRMHNGSKASDKYHYSSMIFEAFNKGDMNVLEAIAFVASICFDPVQDVSSGYKSFQKDRCVFYAEWLDLLNLLRSFKDPYRAIINFVQLPYIFKSLEERVAYNPVGYFRAIMLQAQSRASPDFEITPLLDKAIRRYLTDKRYQSELIQFRGNPALVRILNIPCYRELIPSEDLREKLLTDPYLKEIYPDYVYPEQLKLFDFSSDPVISSSDYDFLRFNNV